jgi:hypothetical protein
MSLTAAQVMPRVCAVQGFVTCQASGVCGTCAFVRPSLSARTVA